MPVHKCPNGKYRIGSGGCNFDSKEKAEAAYKAYLAKKDSKNEKKNANIDSMIDAIDKEITELYEMSSVLYSIKNVVEFFRKKGSR
ncbi:MAG: hypothetical protein V3V14_11235 [Saprospiraceae bacterium]